jgi:hypothetical protein
VYPTAAVVQKVQHVTLEQRIVKGRLLHRVAPSVLADAIKQFIDGMYAAQSTELRWRAIDKALKGMLTVQ